MKKCPVGVICIENITLFYILISIFILCYCTYMYIYKHKNIQINNTITNKEDTPIISYPYTTTNYPYSNLPPYSTHSKDVYLNPYTPPLKDERYLVPEITRYPLSPSIPVNIATNIGAVDTPYRQTGILTSINTQKTILPLMGRPLFINRDKWQFYTMNENNIKLSINKNGKSCTNEYGCDNLYNGDTVYVDGFDDTFKITVYENDTIKYIPYI
jgi:hypothetical protein